MILPAAKASPHILHIAGWYPCPWNEMEATFVRDQVRFFMEETGGNVIVVQVRQDPAARLKLKTIELDGGVRGFYLFTRLPPGRLTEALATLLLVYALVRVRAWRFSILHFHVAYPSLMHIRSWRWLFRKPILISEHWSAYHYGFHLRSESKALARMRRPFEFGLPVLAVSKSLLNDIRVFAQRDDFPGYVLPNVVPIHGPSFPRNAVPLLFSVNRWEEIKDPMPMLAGMARVRANGLRFQLLIGGYGGVLDRMKAFVAESDLADCTRFLGVMTKAQIAEQLALADGFVFSSRYETFSVACAEALGAGVPLIGPFIPAIAEYAGPKEWCVVESRDAAAWAHAASEFLRAISGSGYDRGEIARRAAARFSKGSLLAAYRQVLNEVLTSKLGGKGTPWR